MKTIFNADRRHLGPALLFIAPNFLGFAVFTAGPVLWSLVVAFSNWSILKTEPFAWTGVANFIELLGDSSFWLTLVNTGYLMLGIPFSIAGSLGLAILLHGKLRGVVFFRTLYYLPCFTAGVALMILWKALLNPEFGPVNHMLEGAAATLGADGWRAPTWLQSTANLLGLEVEHVGLSLRQWGVGARDAIITMGLWTAIGGNNMLLYIAALSNVPEELYEAADIDGASGWQKFRNVTWPQLAPTTFFISIMSLIGGLQGGFETARVMTEGGPAGTTKTLAYYIYEKAFTEFRIGYASAVSWVLFTLIFAITLMQWRWGAKNNEE